MSWKPKGISSGFFSGSRGQSRVSINKDKGLIRVQMKTRDGTTKKFIVKKGDTPEAVQSWFESGKGIPANEFMVSMNSDETAIWGIYPVGGMFSGQVTSFPSQEGESPAPKTKTSKDKKYTFRTFTVLVEISEPKAFAGLIVPFNLSYNFEGLEEEYKGKIYTLVAYTSMKSRYTELLMDFCDASGVWKAGPMRYKDNILPLMEKRILQDKKTFSFVLKDGWLNAIFDLSEITASLSEPEDEVEDEDDFGADFDTTPEIANEDELPFDDDDLVIEEDEDDELNDILFE